MTHVVAPPHRPLFLPEPLLSQLSDPGCSVEALAAASFLVPALSFSQVAHQDRFCVSNYILVMSTVDPGSVLRKPVTNGVWGPGHPLPDWQRGPISSGIWHMDSPWHKVAAQLLTVLLAVAWENVRGGRNVRASMPAQRFERHRGQCVQGERDGWFFPTPADPWGAPEKRGQLTRVRKAL